MCHAEKIKIILSLNFSYFPKVKLLHLKNCNVTKFFKLCASQFKFCTYLTGNVKLLKHDLPKSDPVSC